MGTLAEGRGPPPQVRQQWLSPPTRSHWPRPLTTAKVPPRSAYADRGQCGRGSPEAMAKGGDARLRGGTGGARTASEGTQSPVRSARGGAAESGPGRGAAAF